MDIVPAKTPQFAERLVRACDIHPKCPRLHQGRQVWLKKKLSDEGLIVSTEAIRKWLSGEGRPKHENVIPLAKVLNVSASWLSLGAAKLAPVAPPEGVKETAEEAPSLPILIRPGMVVEIRGLPIDLTKAEATKVANIVLAHAVVG